MGQLGVTTPAFDAVTCVAGTTLRAIVTDRLVRTGDLVHLRGGVLVDGWEGILARTRAVDGANGPQLAAAERAAAALGEAVAACRPGEVVGELRARPEVDARSRAWASATRSSPTTTTLAADDVVYVEVLVDQVLLGDVVHVTDGGAADPHDCPDHDHRRLTPRRVSRPWARPRRRLHDPRRSRPISPASSPATGAPDHPAGVPSSYSMWAWIALPVSSIQPWLRA